MTKDWVLGVGHFPVCQIMLPIVVKAEIGDCSASNADSAFVIF